MKLVVHKAEGQRRWLMELNDEEALKLYMIMATPLLYKVGIPESVHPDALAAMLVGGEREDLKEMKQRVMESMAKGGMGVLAAMLNEGHELALAGRDIIRHKRGGRDEEPPIT